ncbi:MAG TPA: hypothetical protein VGG02_05890 [Chthoniobacterales bacterium]|jgi:hypothetical protein
MKIQLRLPGSAAAAAPKISAIIFAILVAAIASGFAQPLFVRQQDDPYWWLADSAFPPFDFTSLLSPTPLAGIAPTFGAQSVEQTTEENFGSLLADFSPREPMLGNQVTSFVGINPQVASNQYWDTMTTDGLQAGSGTWSTSAINWNPSSAGTGTRTTLGRQTTTPFLKRAGLHRLRCREQ